MVERHLTRERSWRFITNLIGVIIVGDSIWGASLQGLAGGLGTDAERPRGRVTLGRRSRPRVRRKLSDLSTKTHDKPLVPTLTVGHSAISLGWLKTGTMF